MDTIVHFIFPLIIALGARMHIKHGLRYVLLLAVISVLLDVDHFYGVARGTLHNVFVVILLPVIFIILAFKYEKTGIKWKSISVASFLFLTSHVLLDLFDNLGVRFFYPFSMKFYNFANFKITTTISTGAEAYILGPAGISLILFFAMVSLVYYLDEVIEIMQKKHESFKKALGDAFRKKEKEFEEEI